MWWESTGRALAQNPEVDEGAPLPNIMPSNGALMLLGAGLAIPAVIAWLADKNDSSNLPEVLFVIAGIVFLVGFVRMIDHLSDRNK